MSIKRATSSLTFINANSKPSQRRAKMWHVVSYSISEVYVFSVAPWYATKRLFGTRLNCSLLLRTTSASKSRNLFARQNNSKGQEDDIIFFFGPAANQTQLQTRDSTQGTRRHEAGKRAISDSPPTCLEI